MNKFEQVSSDGHQMSLAGGAGLGSGGFLDSSCGREQGLGRPVQ